MKYNIINLFHKLIGIFIIYAANLCLPQLSGFKPTANCGVLV